MIKSTFIVFCALFASALNGWGQNLILSGQVIDASDQSYLVGANIILSNIKDTTDLKHTATDDNGFFKIGGLADAYYKAKISSIGYKTHTKIIRVSASTSDLGSVALEQDTKILGGVTIKDKVVAVEQKGDTTLYNAQAYKSNPDANAEDLIAKMPGVVVNASGVQAQGEDVKKVLVDGKEFFGSDPTLALRNLPASIIDKVEVFDQLSDQAQFSGFDDGNTTKTINIVTKPENRNGVFGRVFGGVGTDNRYNIGGNINQFKETKRISVIAMDNNINQQNFSNEDILGVASGNNRRRGGRRGGGGLRNRSVGSNVNDFLTGQQDGITDTRAFGFNYSNEIGDQLKLTGSYFFNQTKNANNQFISNETFLDDNSSQFYNENNLSNSSNYNHRFNLRLQYTIDDHNSIIFTPKLSLQKNESNQNSTGNTISQTGEDISNTINNYNAQNQGYNYSNNLLYRHRFEKRGRTISLNLQHQQNSNSADGELNSFNEYIQSASPIIDSVNQQIASETKGYTVGANLVYTEPIGEKMQMQFNYNISYADNVSERNTFNYDPEGNLPVSLDTALTSNFESGYTTQRPTVGLMYRKGRDLTWRLGIAYQHAYLNSDQQFPTPFVQDKNFNSLLPTFSTRINISKEKRVRVMYRTMTDAPSVTQLQEVVDNTDPLFLASGNQNLDQSYSHMLVTRYSNNNVDKSNTFFTYFMLRQTNDYITNATFIAQQDSLIQNDVVLFSGSQLSKPVNLDGYWNVKTFSSLGKPVLDTKANLNLNFGFGYTRLPGLINDVSNISNTYNVNSGFVLGSNISENVDFNISYNIDYNIVENSIQPDLDNNYLSQLYGVKLNIIFWKGIVFNNQLNYQKYSGFSSGFNQDYTLWNLSLGKKFLKENRAEIKLSVFDLLKQNVSITRTNAESYIQETQTDVLQQYYMLTFTYNIRHFKSKES